MTISYIMLYFYLKLENSIMMKQTNKQIYTIPSFTLLILSISVAKTFITKLETLSIINSVIYQGIVYEK